MMLYRDSALMFALLVAIAACSSDDAVFGAGGAAGVGASGAGATSSSGGGGGDGCDVDCSRVNAPACHIAQCNSSTGDCDVVPSDDGAPCDDGSPCTVADACSAGSCVAGAPKDCSQLTEGCTLGVCDLNDGSCVTDTITQCISGDGCCPANCNGNNDLECVASTQIVRSAIHRGHWRGDGYHNPSDNSTPTGLVNGFFRVSYFIFDLSTVTGTAVTAAELHLEVEAYGSNDPSEFISVWDVSTPWSTVESTSGNMAVYTDLRKGTSYGNTTVLATDLSTVKVIPLNSPALADLQAALGNHFTIGVWLETGNVGQYVRFSAGNEVRVHELHLQVQ